MSLLFDSAAGDLYANPIIQRDIHRLLWIEPFVNKGAPDAGWSCRDHAFVLGCLSRLAGVHFEVVHGKAVYVYKDDSGAAPIGVGQDETVNGMHAWLNVRSVGVVDISPNLSVFQHHGCAIEFSGIIGVISPPGQDRHLVVSDSSARFENAIAAATHRNGLTAVYWPRGIVPFGREEIMHPHEYVDSPLSHRLKKRYDSMIYYKAVLHLIALGSSSRRSLAGVSQNRAWALVAAISDGAAQELKEKMLARDEEAG